MHTFERAPFKGTNWLRIMLASFAVASLGLVSSGAAADTVPESPTSEDGDDVSAQVTRCRYRITAGHHVLLHNDAFGRWVPQGQIEVGVRQGLIQRHGRTWRQLTSGVEWIDVNMSAQDGACWE